ncbi:MAG: hypothetical protein ACKO3K_05920 [Cuspidothrix sp.]
MLSKKTIITNIAIYGIMLSIAAGTAIANPNHETDKQQTAKFSNIEQPLLIKTTVTLGGLGLIGLELWWFLISKPKSKKADVNIE